MPLCVSLCVRVCTSVLKMLFWYWLDIFLMSSFHNSCSWKLFPWCVCEQKMKRLNIMSGRQEWKQAAVRFQQSFTLFRQTTLKPGSLLYFSVKTETALEIYQYMRRINKKGIGFSSAESWSLIITHDHKSLWQGGLRWETSTSPHKQYFVTVACIRADEMTRNTYCTCKSLWITNNVPVEGCNIGSIGWNVGYGWVARIWKRRSTL